ncbi:hypothetical protein GCM10028793_54680 [Nocardiopsis oceani]
MHVQRRCQQVFGLGFNRTERLPRRRLPDPAVEAALPSGIRAPAVPHTAARQFRTHTGFPDHICGIDWPGKSTKPPEPGEPRPSPATSATCRQTDPGNTEIA